MFLNLNTKLGPLGVWPFINPENLYVYTSISLTEGCFIPNINAFGTVVCERISFQICKISAIAASVWAQKGSAPWFAHTWIPIPWRCFQPNLVN